MLPLWVFTCASVALGYLAHGLAMGEPPSLGAVAPAMTVALLAGHWSRRRGWSLPSLIVAVQSVQLCCHGLFAVTDPMSGMPRHGYLPGNVMIVAHCLAGLSVALLLRRGELLLSAVGRLMHFQLGGLLRRPPIPTTRRVFGAFRRGAPASGALLPRSLFGRAPPSAAVVFSAR